MVKKNNGRARWIIVALAVAGLIFNSGVLYNDVKHLKNDLAEVKKEIRFLRECVMETK
jgi:hypothetical protein